MDLKYTVIKTKAQYNQYCSALESIVAEPPLSSAALNEAELLTLLIEKWDQEHNPFGRKDPVQLLHSFMQDHGLRPSDLQAVLEVSKGYISDILHYRKGLSKGVIRRLSGYFRVSQEAFNRPYALARTRSDRANPRKKSASRRRKVAS
jgi:HTH-type transcriptional regulator/antitoxin HigA